MNYQDYKKLSNSEVPCDLVPIVITRAVGLYLLKDGWTHTDQIVKGIKKVEEIHMEKKVTRFFANVHPIYVVIVILIGISIGDFLNSLIIKIIDSFIINIIVGGLSIYFTLIIASYIFYLKMKQ
ncbi:hypothetical protein AB3K25_00840 [Leuconostoc sp. MS02]|uniref:Uncharacterized protein n=1 Tax=Leuconostoc aquikimchii TaxID=3236804 RepID=A0ABV3S6Q4_9LACO